MWFLYACRKSSVVLDSYINLSSDRRDLFIHERLNCRSKGTILEWAELGRWSFRDDSHGRNKDRVHDLRIAAFVFQPRETNQQNDNSSRPSRCGASDHRTPVPRYS
jgi:hypothetical protein